MFEQFEQTSAFFLIVHHRKYDEKNVHRSIIPQNILKGIEEDVDVSGLKDKRRPEPDASVSAASQFHTAISKLRDQLVPGRRKIQSQIEWEIYDLIYIL